MKILTTILFSGTLFASVLVTPQDALKMTFGPAVEVSKKNLLLKSSEAEAVEKRAKTALTSKIIRLYIAKTDSVKGYGILLNRKVRTKNAAVLYLLEPDGTLKAAEIVTFKEPQEYLPSTEWMKQFADVNATDTLFVGGGVSVITGATLTARTVSDGARLAIEIFKEAVAK